MPKIYLNILLTALSILTMFAISNYSYAVDDLILIEVNRGDNTHLQFAAPTGEAAVPAKNATSNEVYNYCVKQNDYGTTENMECLVKYMGGGLDDQNGESKEQQVSEKPGDPCNKNQVMRYCADKSADGENQCHDEYERLCSEEESIASGPSCQSLSDQAQRCCNGDTSCLIGGDDSGELRSGMDLIKQAAAQASAPGSADSMKKVCQIQQGVAAASLALNLSAAAICGRKKSQCMTACENESGPNGRAAGRYSAKRRLEVCGDLRLNLAQFALQVGSSSIGMLTAGQCLEDVKNQEIAFNTSVAAPVGEVNCSDPAQASNPICQLCSGPNAANNPNCNFNSNNQGSLLNNSNRDSNLSGIDTSISDDLFGAEAIPDGPTAPSANRTTGGGGGGGGGGIPGGGGGGGGFGGGGGGEGGGEASTASSGLTPGYSAQSGYSSGGGSYGYEGGGGSGKSGAYRGYGSGKDGDKFNLNKFLPNGGKNKLGKRGSLDRGLATVPGIAATHGNIWKQITKRYQAVCVRKALVCGK